MDGPEIVNRNDLAFKMKSPEANALVKVGYTMFWNRS